MSQLQQAYKVEFDHPDPDLVPWAREFRVIDAVELFDRLLGPMWSWALDEPGGSVKITRTG